MLPATELQALGPVHAPVPAESVGDARQQAFQRSLQTLLGKPLQGEVLARLNDGSFMVRVAGAAARMMLPAGVQVGAQVPMTLLTLSPRPTFQISSGAAPATLAYPEAGPEFLPGLETPALPDPASPTSPASLAATLLNRAVSAASQLPGFDPAAPATRLSDAARAITTALATVRGAGAGIGPALAIIGTSPLLVPPVMLPEQLAQRLKAALGESGLFYESHVAEWAAGKRSLSELMREPQMHLRSADSTPGNLPGAPHLAAAQLLDLQLQTLEQARLQWQGEAWPGQPMQWEIQKEGAGGAHDGQARDGEEAQAAWRSGVVFRFPLLGAVSASLVLSGGQVQIRMHAASPDSVALLRLHAGSLEKSLAGAGSPLSALSISQREAGSDGK